MFRKWVVVRRPYLKRGLVHYTEERVAIYHIGEPPLSFFDSIIEPTTTISRQKKEYDGVSIQPRILTDSEKNALDIIMKAYKQQNKIDYFY